MKTRVCVGGISAALIYTASIAALAQSSESASGTEAAAGGLQEIVVSARRRSEKIENVPATVQALDAQALIERGIRSENELQSAVPGLMVRANNNNNQLYYAIRGESMEPYAGTVPGVQPYLNETALSGNSGVAFYDLENVQVLKGPQGTLFGRNSTGGAVLYKAAQPKNTFGGYATAEFGNLDKRLYEAAINLPIVSDKVLLRAAGLYQSGGAFVKNVYDGSEVGDSKVKSGRATLQLSPNNAIVNTTMVQYSDWEGTNYGDYPVYVEPCGPNQVGPGFPCFASAGNAFFDRLVTSPQGTYYPGWPNGNVYPGGLATIVPYLKSLGRYVIDNNGNNIYLAKDTVAVNTTTFNLSDASSIKNIFGYNHTKREMSYDNDSTPYPWLNTGGDSPGGSNLETRTTENISDELQWQGKTLNGHLDYIVGAFYSKARTLNNNPVSGLGYLPALDVSYTFAIRYKSRSIDESYALFTQGTYAVTDKLNITAGARQTWDKLSLEQLPGSLFYGSPKQHANQDDVSWTLSADYRFTPDLMAYVTSRRSWRVGGYNPFVPPGAGNTTAAAEGGNYFPPETVQDVELGLKYNGRVLGVPAHIYADAFQSWIKNSQKNAFIVIDGNNTSATTVVPKARVRGVEIDTAISPLDWWQLGVTYSFVDAKYTDNVAVLFGTVNAYGPYSDTPRHSGTAYTDFTYALPGSLGALKWHIDAYHQTSFHTSNLGNTFNPHDELPGYTLLNSRLDWTDAFGVRGITASLYGKNLTDKYYFVGGGGGIQLFGLNSGVFGPPRTYGLGLRYDF